MDRRISLVTLDNCSTNDAMVDMFMGLIPTDSMLIGWELFSYEVCGSYFKPICEE